jgi:hypothetical protein
MWRASHLYEGSYRRGPHKSNSSMYNLQQGERLW